MAITVHEVSAFVTAEVSALFEASRVYLVDYGNMTDISEFPSNLNITTPDDVKEVLKQGNSNEHYPFIKHIEIKDNNYTVGQIFANKSLHVPNGEVVDKFLHSVIALYRPNLNGTRSWLYARELEEAFRDYFSTTIYKGFAGSTKSNTNGSAFNENAKSVFDSSPETVSNMSIALNEGQKYRSIIVKY
jgi:hypothetical protein